MSLVGVEHIYGNPAYSGGHFLPPADNTYDLGSDAFSWRNLYVDTLIYVGGTVMQGNFLPSADDTYAIGSAAYRWSGITVGGNGLDVNPDSDGDADLITVGVTGAPNIKWQEADDMFFANKGLLLGDWSNHIPASVAQNYALGVMVDMDTDIATGDGATTIRAAWFRAKVTAKREDKGSITAVQAQLNLRDGGDTIGHSVDMSPQWIAYSGIFAYIQAHGITGTALNIQGGTVLAAVDAAVNCELPTTDATSHVVGVMVRHLVSNKSAMNAASSFAGVKISAVTGYVDWDVGLEIDDSTCDIGIDIGTTPLGIDFTGTYSTAAINLDAGKITHAYAMTATDENEEAYKLTITDASLASEDMHRGIVVDYTASGAKTGTAHLECFSADVTLTANTPQTAIYGAWVTQDGNPVLGYVIGMDIYFEDLGTNIGNLMGMQITVDGTNAAGARHTPLRLTTVGAGNTKAGLLMDVLAVYGLDMGGSTLSTADIRFSGGTTLTDDGADLTLDGANLVMNSGYIGLLITDTDSAVEGQIWYDDSENTIKVCTGSVDSVVLLTAAQTLTNKTLTSPTIANLTNMTHDHKSASKGGDYAWADFVAADVTYLQALVADITQSDLVDKSATESISGTWTLASPTINGTIGTTGLTLPAITLGGAVAGGDQGMTGVGDMTFTNESIIAAAAANTNTLLIKAGGLAGTTVITIASLDAGDRLSLAQVYSFVAMGDLDIGAHGFRANTLTVDGLTATRVVFAGTDGLLSGDSGFTFSSDTLTVAKIGAFEATGAINFADQNMTNVDIDSGDITGVTISGGLTWSAAQTFGAGVTCSSTLAVTGIATFSTHVRLGDNDYLQFGDAQDAYIYWTGSQLHFIAAGDVLLAFGVASAGVDIRFYSSVDGNRYLSWDASADKLIFHGSDMLFEDGDYLQFGDDVDVQFYWADTWFGVVAAANTLWAFGAASSGMDVRFYSSVDGNRYLSWDASADALLFHGCSMYMEDADFIYWGDSQDVMTVFDSDGKWMIYGGSADLLLQIGYNSQGMDVRTYGNTGGAYMEWDASADKLTFNANTTLDVAAATLTLAADQISGDKVEGGTIGAITITTLTVGDMLLGNDWAFTEHEEYGVAVRSPSGRLYKMQLEEIA